MTTRHRYADTIGARGPSSHRPDLSFDKPAWMGEAVCAQTDPEMFHIDLAQGDYRIALGICSTCPVRRECLDTFIDEAHGVFGGTTRIQREKLRRDGWKPGDPLPAISDPAATRKGMFKGHETAPCGTYAAYRAHGRRGEEPCGDCKAASAAYRKELHARKRASA